MTEIFKNEAPYIGYELDAKDKRNKWYNAKIIKINRTTGDIKVHFNGWASKFD